MYNQREQEIIKNSVFYKVIIDNYHKLVERNICDPEKLDWNKDISKILDIMYYKAATLLAEIFLEVGYNCSFDEVYSNVTESITEVTFRSESFDSVISQLYNWADEMKVKNAKEAHYASVLYGLHREFTDK